MDKSSQRSNKKVSLLQNLWIFLLLIVFIWLVFSSIRMIRTYAESRRNRVAAENQKIEVESDINDIDHKLDLIKTEQGIEEHIRLKYPFVKDGERVLVINNDDGVGKLPKKTFWQKIKSIF